MLPAAENILIASLNEKNRELLVSQSTSVTLPLRSVLYEAGAVPSDAYFLTSGLASVVGTTSEGETAEVGIVGREGLVGGTHLLGPALPPHGLLYAAGGVGAENSL